MQELDILLTPVQEPKIFSQDIAVVRLFNDKNLKDHLVRVNLPNVEKKVRSNHVEKGTVRFMILFVIHTLFGPILVARQSKIQYESLKVVCLLKCRICGESPYIGEGKMTFRARFNS